jgi:ABC-type glycerol-3-phosphate transport system permease component
MILSVTLLPFIFVFFDAFMGNIMQFFNGSKPPVFTSNDINNFQYLRNDYNSFFNSVSNTRITTMGTVYSLQSLLTTYATELQKLKT